MRGGTGSRLESGVPGSATCLGNVLERSVPQGPIRPVQTRQVQRPAAPRHGVDAGRAWEAPQRGRAMSLPGGLPPSLRAPAQSGKVRMKKLPKRSQNEKYRLKYLRLRKAAKATVFVSLTPFGPLPRHCPNSRNLSPDRPPSQSGTTNSVSFCRIHQFPVALCPWTDYVISIILFLHLSLRTNNYFAKL